MYNPNLCSDESGRGFSEAEVRVASMTARLVGYDPARSGGLFTFGGTGTLLYGVKVGLEKALPGTRERGYAGQAVILCSEHSHYACLNVAGWLGIGQENVVRVPTHRRQLDRPGGPRSGRPRGDCRRPSGSPRSSPRWARPMPLASTTWRRSTRCASGWSPICASTTGRTCMPTR